MISANSSISSLHKDNQQFNSITQTDTNMESPSVKRKELQYRILETKKRLHSVSNFNYLLITKINNYNFKLIINKYNFLF